MIDSLFRWRKATDIHRTYPLFELLKDDYPLLDLGLSEEGAIEISFNSSIEMAPLDLKVFLALIEEGVALVNCEKL